MRNEFGAQRKRAQRPGRHGVTLGFVGRDRDTPSLAQLRREGRAASRRITGNDMVIRRTSKQNLLEWIGQARRLWIATEKYGLTGKAYLAFATDIGIKHRSTAYHLLKLHVHCRRVLRLCRQKKVWPGWESALEWVGEADDAGHSQGFGSGGDPGVAASGKLSAARRHGSHEYLTGSCFDMMRTLDPHSVQMAVTSPPYFRQRLYGAAQWHGGDDAQIGMETTPDEYVAHLVAVFREMKRVLKPDGALWLNLGDTYAGSGRSRSGGSRGSKQETNPGACNLPPVYIPGMTNKQLLGIPWRVAFALQQDGSWCRRIHRRPTATADDR